MSSVRREIQDGVQNISEYIEIHIEFVYTVCTQFSTRSKTVIHLHNIWMTQTRHCSPFVFLKMFNSYWLSSMHKLHGGCWEKGWFSLVEPMAFKQQEAATQATPLIDHLRMGNSVCKFSVKLAFHVGEPWNEEDVNDISPSWNDFQQLLSQVAGLADYNRHEIWLALHLPPGAVVLKYKPMKNRWIKSIN